jgi:hypothetical protein
VEREEDRLGVYEVTRAIVTQVPRKQEPAHESTSKPAILSRPDIPESPEPRYPMLVDSTSRRDGTRDQDQE